MALTPGTRVGPYEITALLGAGGMGEVHRARDTKLNRDVALKVLPANFALDKERLARLRREAQVLASFVVPSELGTRGPITIAAAEFRIVLNWFDELKARVPVN
jgi:serine/threonine protein kinase